MAKVEQTINNENSSDSNGHDTNLKTHKLKCTSTQK